MGTLLFLHLVLMISLILVYKPCFYGIFNMVSELSQKQKCHFNYISKKT